MAHADPNPVYPGNLIVTIGGDSSTTVQRNDSSTVQSNQSLNVGKDLSVTVNKHLVLQAGDSISIVCGAASLTLKKDGSIVIKGKDITLDASGDVYAKPSRSVRLHGSKIGSN